MKDFAVIGAGASGTIQALHLLKRGAGRVTLVERERIPGRGTAYGTGRPEHLLNVTARRMIVDPDDPDQFAVWMAPRGGTPDTYAERRRFGDFLVELMEAAGDSISIVRGEAVAIDRRENGETVRLAEGRQIEADCVILALGNLRPAVPSPFRPETLDDAWVDDPWFGDLAGGLSTEDEILLVGTGLTAVDAALTLDAEGFGGRVTALSRRGLVPRPHVARDPVAEPKTDFPASNVQLVLAVRRRAAEIGWREAVHEVRGDAQRLWSTASLEERRRFLRHLRPWWDVHRHRIAPAVAERVERMQKEGRLRFAAGRVQSAAAEGRQVRVEWRPRGGSGGEVLRVSRIVNCSGPELDVERAGDPLLDRLLGDGRIRADSCRLGIDVDPSSRVRDRNGSPDGRLLAIGPMTRGAFWESIAVSDIAVQARDVARFLLP